MRTTIRLVPLALALAVEPLALASDAEEMEAPAPHEKFEDPARVFQEVKEELLHGYYRDDVSEADLYRKQRAAMEQVAQAIVAMEREAAERATDYDVAG